MIIYSRTKLGSIHFFEQHDNGSSTNGIIRKKDEWAIVESGAYIAPYSEPEKTSAQQRYDIISKLKALDSTSRTIESAILGDQYAIDKIAENEVAKVSLRNELKLIPDNNL